MTNDERDSSRAITLRDLEHIERVIYKATGDIAVALGSILYHFPVVIEGLQNVDPHKMVCNERTSMLRKVGAGGRQL